MLKMLEEIQSIDIKSTSTRSVLYERLRTDTELRGKIKKLSKQLLSQEIGSCINCFIDAVVQLQRLNKNKMSTQKPEYVVKAGALIRDVVNLDASKTLTANNCREELALYHLAVNPNCKKFFSRLPKDIDNRVEEYAKKSKLKAKIKPKEDDKIFTVEELVDMAKDWLEEGKDEAYIKEQLELNGAKNDEVDNIILEALGEDMDGTGKDDTKQ
jgi:hypothetical protein